MDSALIFLPRLSLSGLSDIVPISQSCFSCVVNGRRFLLSPSAWRLGGSWNRGEYYLFIINKLGLRSSCRGSAVINPASIHEDVGLIPDLAQWVKAMALS